MLYVISSCLPFHLTFQDNIPRLILTSGFVQANIYFVFPSFCHFSSYGLESPISQSLFSLEWKLQCFFFFLPRAGLLSNHDVYIFLHLLIHQQIFVECLLGASHHLVLNCFLVLLRPSHWNFILYFILLGVGNIVVFLRVLTLGSYRGISAVSASWQLHDLGQIIAFPSFCFFLGKSKGLV